ncbi:MrpH family fimbial adhesin [Serratia marcescens]|uniref:MrpH family fimbial adhesin n=1 Tax=Serratia marcescens TaxID=615 RepID=UPI000E3E6E10|nr:hypothetical protein [Serratia marcescens]RFS88284.1 hypothetical protein CIB53_21290 [Serratia marcescens]
MRELVFRKREEVCKFFFTLLVSVYLTGMPAAIASISLNAKWTQDWRGLWSLSISPQGTYDFNHDFQTAKCLGTGWWPCEGQWRIYIKNKASFYCEPLVSGSVGMTMGVFQERMMRAYSGKTCTISDLVLDGTEKICVMSYFTGEWSNGWTLYSGGPMYATSGCNESPPGGGEGETVLPPVKPLSCSLNNTISLAHGTVDYSRLGESQATYLATVNCTRQATVKLTIPNSGKVNFKNDGSFYSVVSVMDKPGGAQLSVNGPMQVKFSSRLYHVGNDALSGDFKSSAVVVLDIL